MTTKNFKARVGIQAPLVAAEDGTTALTLTNTTGDVTVAGDLTVTGNDIKSSSATSLTLSGADVAVAGDLTVTGNDIKSSTATALSLSGADVTVAGDLTVTGNDIKSSTATALSLSGADVTVAGDLTVTGNDIKSSSATAITLSGSDVTLANDLTVTGDQITVPATTYVSWPEASTRANRLNFKSTTGNTSGIRVMAPVATSAGDAIVASFSTNDIDNGSFINIRSMNTGANPLRIQTGTYTAGVLGASPSGLAFVDNATIYATINPSGPTATTDLTTKSYVDGLVDNNTTYTQNASTVSGGANLNLVGSDSTTDTIKIASGTGVTVSRTDADTITVTNSGVTGLTAGTYLSASASTGDVTLSTNATNANTASTIVARDASGNFSAGTVTANLADTSYVLGQLIVTPTTAYTPPASALTTVTGTNGIVVASSTGNNANIAIRYSSGDTTSGTASSASLLMAGTSGTSTAPGGIAINQVAGNINIDGYTAGTSNNFASQIATINQGAGTASISPLQIQGYARQAFTNSTTTATTVTGASGTGSTATITFTAQNTAPYVVGQTVVIAGIVPSGYNNAAAVITAATTSSISYANTTSTSYTSGGTITAANTVTAAGMGFRVRGFANSTAMSVANRINFIDFTTSAANFKSAAYSFADDVITGTTLTAKTYMSLAATVGTVNQDTFTVKNTAATSTYASFAATVGTVNQDTFTVKNTAATSTYASLAATVGTVNQDTLTLKNTAATTTYATFASGGSTIGGVDNPSTFTRVRGASAGTSPSLLIKNSNTVATAPATGDGTTFRLSTTGSNATTYTIADIGAQYSTGGDNSFIVQVANGDQTTGTFTGVTLINSKVTSTTIAAGTASGTAGSSAVATKLTVDANKITAAVPFVFPNYTIAAAGAITGAVGWQIAISDSPTATGRMAFWSTTATAGWRYVDTNLAI